MTYSTGNLIQASDFNAFVGDAGNAISTINTLNTVWGIGNGRSGYGQPTVPQVAQYSSIAATDWANLINTTNTIATHQGTSITSLTAPAQYSTIAALTPISTNLTSIYTARNNAVAQSGTTVTAATVNNTGWNNAITFTHTVAFESGDRARYFFNAGGQIKIQFSSPAGTGINSLFNSLATACGTLVISAPSSGSITVASTSYNGFTKIGGSGTVTTLLSNVGYYGLTTSNQEVFKQFASGSPAGYVGSYISVNVRSNGTQGSNGDAGSQIVITTVWDEVPNGLNVAAGTTTSVTAFQPSTSYLSRSWGTVSVVGSVTGN